MRRPPIEYLVLVSLVGSLAFYGYLAFYGSWRFKGNELAGIALVTVALGLGAVALWQLILRRSTGAMLSAIFYGVQVLNVTFPSGAHIGFNSLPTLYYRIYGEKEAPVNLNVVSLFLFVSSLLLWAYYRARQKTHAP
jgi:hypothetical protein